MTRSAEEIEREVEASRADLDETIDALKSKMSPGQLIDELAQSLKGSGAGAGAAEMLGKLGDQVKENPMAVAMVGAGLAWLMMGKSGPAATGSAVGYPTTYAPTAGEDGGSVGGGLGALKDRAADAVQSATSAVGDTGAKIKDGAAAAADQVKDAAQSIGDGVSGMGQKARQTLLDTLDREPLVIGALGLAVGVAIGAALPSTPLEDRTFGASRDNLRDEIKDRASEGLDVAKDAAAAAVEGVRAMAEEDGLIDEGGSVVDKAKTLLQAGVDAAKDRVGQEGEAGAPGG